MTNEMIERLFEFRDELGRREEAVMKQMAQLWLNVERGVRAEAERLTEEIARRQALGEAVPIQFVRRWERYQRYTEQAQAQLRSYDAAVQPILERGVRANLQLGLDSANETLELAYSGIEAPSWSRLNVEAVEQMAGMLRPTTALGALLRRGSDLAFDEAEAALVRGLALGRGAKQVAADIADAAGFSFERSILIARTEMNRAYRFASTAQYRDSGVVTGFRRQVYKPTACFACLMMDGEYYPVEQELYDHPRGKCGLVPVVVGGHSPSWETGKEWFTKLPEEEQRRIMGAGRYELWKGGGVRDLRSMVWMKPNAQWGPAPAVIPLKELVNLPSEQSAMFSVKTRSEILSQPEIPSEELERLLRNAERAGISISRSADWDRYLEMWGSEGVTYSSGEIILHTHTTYSAFFEELIHYSQAKKAGFIEVPYIAVINNEIEAQNKLLKWQEVYKLSEIEVNYIQRNLRYWEELRDQELKKGR